MKNKSPHQEQKAFHATLDALKKLPGEITNISSWRSRQQPIISQALRDIEDYLGENEKHALWMEMCAFIKSNPEGSLLIEEVEDSSEYMVCVSSSKSGIIKPLHGDEQNDDFTNAFCRALTEYPRVLPVFCEILKDKPITRHTMTELAFESMGEAFAIHMATEDLTAAVPPSSALPASRPSPRI